VDEASADPRRRIDAALGQILSAVACVPEGHAADDAEIYEYTVTT
jgi:hypothetical protein